DGRAVVAHCPEDYCALQVDDALTGRRLSTPDTGRSESFFHSRLAANRQGTRLLSAGWYWHPFDLVQVYDLRPDDAGAIRLEACHDSLRDRPGGGLRAGMIGVYDLDAQRLVSAARLEDEAGTLMPVGEGHVIGFHEHPKLIELATGRVVARWPDLASGRQLSSILRGGPTPPPLALDPERGRFAVADDRRIAVVTLAPELWNT
ncbi:MAG: hypothetical protein K2X91_15320, partial [Thermoleophilia bacterium]|nr:hypothetical protein [Thermoleophilia bacterium]